MRLLPNCLPDTSYGENGLWVSPLRPTHRMFTCAGETTNGLAGHEASRIVMYGVTTDGGANPQPGDPPDGLLGTFGHGGIAETDIGGQVRTTSITADANWIYVAAQRLNPPGDADALVTRFSTNTGAQDANFGTGGIAPITLEEPSPEPAGPLLLQRAARPKDTQPARPARVLAAVNRTTANIDCDHIPAVLTLEQSTGKPVADEGHGGTTMVSRLGDPAIVDKDGSITAAYRPTPSWPIFTPGPLTLRRIDAAGRLGNLIDVPVTIVGATSDGSPGSATAPCWSPAAATHPGSPS